MQRTKQLNLYCPQHSQHARPLLEVPLHAGVTIYNNYSTITDFFFLKIQLKVRQPTAKAIPIAASKTIAPMSRLGGVSTSVVGTPS